MLKFRLSLIMGLLLIVLVGVLGFFATRMPQGRPIAFHMDDTPTGLRERNATDSRPIKGAPQETFVPPAPTVVSTGELSETPELTVIIVSESGSPIPDVDLRLSGITRSGRRVDQRTDAAGRVVCRLERPGKVGVESLTADYEFRCAFEVNKKREEARIVAIRLVTVYISASVDTGEPWSGDFACWGMRHPMARSGAAGPCNPRKPWPSGGFAKAGGSRSGSMLTRWALMHNTSILRAMRYFISIRFE